MIGSVSPHSTHYQPAQQSGQALSGAGRSRLDAPAREVTGTQRLDDGPMTADRAAGNILLFIENRLLADAADGASKEQLQSRLEAGLQGFLQGFGEARSQLQDMGLLTEELDAEIGQTYEKVLKGLSALAETLELDDSAIREAQTNGPNGGEATPAEDPGLELDSPAAIDPTSIEGLVKARRSFEFTVLTREGDQVTIRAGSQYAAGAWANAGGVGAASSSRQWLDFTVQGDLNADELAAINDLLGQVNDLSDQFYAGDFDGAFEAALALNFDADDIAGFALDLRQSLVQKVQKTYGQPQTPVQGQLQTFVDMADQIKAALESARQFLEPITLLNNLLEQSLGKAERGHHELFGDVTQSLLERLAPASVSEA